jgi:hypothetical protein
MSRRNYAACGASTVSCGKSVRCEKKRQRISRAGDRLDPVRAFALVEREQVNHAVVRLCHVLGVLGCLPQRLLGLAQTPTIDAGAGGC